MNTRFDGPTFSHPIHAGLRAKARATYDAAYDVPHRPMPAKIIPSPTRTELRLAYWPQLSCCGDGSRRVHETDCVEGEIDRRASALVLLTPLSWPEARARARADMALEENRAMNEIKILSGRYRLCPPTPVTDRQIAALMSEASAAGDTATVRHCQAALRGDRRAREACAMVLDDARAMDDKVRE